MHAPSWLCRELVRRFPDARLAWAGRPAETDDELNGGTFALVQLYPMSIVHSMEEPDIYEELWDVTTIADEFGRMRRVRSYRGPIFNRDGGTKPDWDPLFWVPIYKLDFDEQGVDLAAFYRGDWLHRLTKDSIKPIIQARREAAGKRLLAAAQEKGREAFDYLKHMKSQDDSRPQVVANKHASGELKKFYERKQKREQELLDFYRHRTI